MRPFAIGRLEVTFDEWEACLIDGGCPHWPDHRGWGRGQRPVINVSWEDAQAYVAWLNRRVRRESGDQNITYRLPSEAEWEYVARAGTASARWWGDNAAAGKAVCRGCGISGSPAGTALPGDVYSNPFGVQHILGNVWEWVADCRNPDLTGMPSDARARSDGDCAQRGLRGGSWDTAPRGVRAATRAFYPANRRSDNIGFRVATDVKSGP